MKVRVRRAWMPWNDGPGCRPWYVELVNGDEVSFADMKPTHAEAVRRARHFVVEEPTA